MSRASDAIETLARAIHDGWRADIAASRAKDASAGTNANDVAFDELEPGMRASNIAAAKRVATLLGLAGLELVRGVSQSPAEESAVRAQIEHHLELLAEAEHDEWMKEKRDNGWRYADVRDNEKKLHNLLIPFGKLPPSEQNKDRAQVRGYVEFAKKAGLSVAFIGVT